MTAPNKKRLKLDGLELSVRNVEEAERIYQDIFKNNDYQFTTENPHPYIIDCGAHIGLASIYFKQHYPSAKIVAIEANPQNAALIQTNIALNHYSDITVINGAVTNSRSEAALYIDPNPNNPWSWGDTVIPNLWGKDVARETITVPTINLNNFINKPIDLLKLDIEGAELAVLKDIQQNLSLVSQIIIEIHNTPTMPENYADQIISLLEQHKFNATDIPSNGWKLIKAERK